VQGLCAASSIRDSVRRQSLQEVQDAQRIPTSRSSAYSSVKLAVALVLCVPLSACGLVMDSAFDTTQEAIDADMVDKGWIPDWVPHAATHLREVHDLDSNTSALAFTKPRTLPLKLPADCRAIASGDSDPVAFNRNWWPGEATLNGSYRVLRCTPQSGKSVFVAVSRSEDRVLFWRTYPR